MEPSLLLVEKLDNIIRITLSRPEKKNAIHTKMAGELVEALEAAEEDEDVRAVILTGAGKAFSAGGDIQEMAEAEDRYSFLGDELAGGIQRCVSQMRSMGKPVIAAVNGNAIGAGMALVLGSDIVIASKDARFSMGFVKIGLAPGCGTYFLSRLVGYQKACELVFYSDVLDAEDAEELGLVNKVVKGDKLESKALEWAERVTRRPAPAIAVSKRLLNHAYMSGIKEHFAKERDAIGSTGSTKEFDERITAFLSKKK